MATDVVKINIPVNVDTQGAGRQIDYLTRNIKQSAKETKKLNAEFQRSGSALGGMAKKMLAFGGAFTAAIIGIATLAPSLSGDLALLKVSLMKLGEALAPAIQPIIQGFRDMVEEATSFIATHSGIKDMGKTIGKFISEWGFETVVGLFGILAAVSLVGVIGGVGLLATALLGLGQIGFGSLMLNAIRLGPLGLIAIGLTGLILLVGKWKDGLEAVATAKLEAQGLPTDPGELIDELDKTNDLVKKYGTPAVQEKFGRDAAQIMEDAAPLVAASDYTGDVTPKDIADKKKQFQTQARGGRTRARYAVDTVKQKVSKTFTQIKENKTVKAFTSGVKKYASKAKSWFSGLFGGKQDGGLISKTGAYMLHQGEKVVPRNLTQMGGGSQPISINIQTGAIRSQADISALVDQISREMSFRQTFARGVA